MLKDDLASVSCVLTVASFDAQGRWFSAHKVSKSRLGLVWFAPELFMATTCTIWFHFQIRDWGAVYIFAAHLLVFGPWHNALIPVIQICPDIKSQPPQIGLAMFRGSPCSPPTKHGVAFERCPTLRIGDFPQPEWIVRYPDPGRTWAS